MSSATKTKDPWYRPVVHWLDSWAGDQEEHLKAPNNPDWFRIMPFIGLHIVCLAVIWVGWSWVAVSVAAALYIVRMFAITGFYHRYFSHKTYKTSRVAQFIFGLIGTSATQRGPLWWAAHHRKHHKHSDDEHDVHSPRQHGLLWSHMLWFTTRPNFPTDLKYIPDMAKYPELRFLDRFDILPPVLLAVSCLLLGIGLNYWFPGLETSGAQMLIWGFFISTVVLFHATCTINSLSHMIGKQRYETGDDSRNSWFLAILTFGEGWHNNHHHYPHSVRQGFRWWEYDFTFYALWVMSKLGIIWDMRAVPERLKTDDPQPTVARTSSDDNPDPDTKREKAA